MNLRFVRLGDKEDALVEATPEATLAEALEDLGAVQVALLVRAVRHDHEDTQG